MALPSASWLSDEVVLSASLIIAVELLLAQVYACLGAWTLLGPLRLLPLAVFISGCGFVLLPRLAERGLSATTSNS